MPITEVQLTVTVGGNAVAAESATVSRGIGQSNGQARVVALDASPSIGDEVVIVAGHVSTGQIFSGLVASYAPGLDGRITIDARDRLERMGMPWGGSARVYSPYGTVTHDDASIIRNLLEAYAIPSSDANIESSQLGELAVVNPIRLEPGAAPWGLIRELDELASYATFSRGDGNIYRRPLATGSGGDFDLISGVNLISATRTRTRDGVYNRCQVVGLEYVGTAVAGSADAGNGSIPDPPGYITKDLRTNIVETSGCAGTVATNYVAAYGADRDRIEATIVGDAGVDVGYSVSVSSTMIGSGSYLVTGIDHSVSRSGFTTTVRGEKFA
jgi:hypothetical protein